MEGVKTFLVDVCKVPAEKFKGFRGELFLFLVLVKVRVFKMSEPGELLLRAAILLWNLSICCRWRVCAATGGLRLLKYMFRCKQRLWLASADRQRLCLPVSFHNALHSHRPLLPCLM